MQAFRNSPCWSESSPRLNCIINYSEGSESEGKSKERKRNRQGARVRWGDGAKLYNTPSWSCSHSLSLSVNEGWGEGRSLGYLSEWLCYIPEKGRGGG